MNKLVERIFSGGLLLIFAGIIIHTPLTLWLGTIYPDSALIIKSWKEILMFLLIPAACWLVTRRRLWGELAKDWIFRLIIVYAVVHVLLVALLWQGYAQTFAGIGIDLRYILFFGLVYVLVRTLPVYRAAIIKVAVGGALIITGFATMQFFLPADILAPLGYNDQTIKPYQTVDENPDYVRVNSTLRGPNPLGAYAAAVLAIAAAYVVIKKRERKNPDSLVGVVGVFGTIALWLSYSRSAIVAALVGVGIAAAASIKKLSPLIIKVTAASIVILFAAAVLVRDTPFVQNVILHDNPTTGGAITSNDDHVSSLQIGLERLIQQPLGAGIGSTGSASLFGAEGIIIENQYLFIAHETGWLGLLLYGALFVLLLWRLFAARRDWLAFGMFTSGITLSLIALLLPVWTDDAVSIIWWGLAATALGGVHGKKRTSK